jgi:hypothetical protein
MKAEFADQTILQGAPEPLNASLGLRRVGRDQLNVEFGEEPGDLGGVTGTLQPGGRLGSVARATEDAVAVGIDGEGKLAAVGDEAEELEVATGVLSGAEECPDPPGGVIDAAHQREPGTAILEPVVITGIDLDEGALLSGPFAAPAMLGGPPGTWSSDPSGAQQAVNGGPGEVNTFVFREHLSEVLSVEVLVLRRGQGHHLLCDPRIETVRGLTTPVAMRQAGGSVVLELSSKALHLTK